MNMKPQYPGKVSENTGLTPTDHNILWSSLKNSYPTWSIHSKCQSCHRHGSYVFASKSLCHSCWLDKAADRGYTGRLENDPIWQEGAEPKSEETPAKMNFSHGANTTKSRGYQTVHLVMDLIIMGALLFTLIRQNAQIGKLEAKVDLLVESSIVLLQDKLERDK